MRDHEFREHGRPEDLLQELGYETQDIQYGKFARYGVFFLAFFLTMIVSGFGIMYLMTSTKLSGGRTVDYIPKTQAPPSTPLLQTNITARTDIRSLKMKETEALTTPAVIDEKHGQYRIPIDQAIDVLAKNGLPKTPAMQSGGVGTAGMSGSSNSSIANDGGTTFVGHVKYPAVQTSPTGGSDVSGG